MYTMKEWAASCITPFYKNVEQEGIELTWKLTDEERNSLVVLQMEKAKTFLKQAS